MPDRRHAPWGVARVHGDSMLPTLRDGDRLLVSYGVLPRAGHLVVARFPDGTLTVKRATEQRVTVSGRPGWWLTSDNADVGVDSRHRGPVEEEAVLAVVRVRMWPWPRPLGPSVSPRGHPRT